MLVALGLSAASRATVIDSRVSPDPRGKQVLDAFDWEPATLEHLAVRTGLALPDLALTVESLLEAGWIEASGGWFERLST